MRVSVCWLMACVPSMAIQVESAAGWVVERANVSSTGEQANGGGQEAFISADGRYVVFDSKATNLVAGDTNGHTDVFIRDRQTGRTERVSVSTYGIQGNRDSIFCSVSANGRFVAFDSLATNLVPNDTTPDWDVFLRDRSLGETSRISVTHTGAQANSGAGASMISADGRFVAFNSDATDLVPGGGSGFWDVFVHARRTGKVRRISADAHDPSISADGRYVAFDSDAPNLVPGDTNGCCDVFIRDRQTGATERVSVSTSGAQGNAGSAWPAVSADGRFVAFSSDAANIVPKDTNDQRDVFVHDRQTGETERVSVSSSGAQGNSFSDWASISGDGRFAAFRSEASTLVSNDGNSWLDVFVHDRQTGRTALVSRSLTGDSANHFSDAPSISADGRAVAFLSSADNIVHGDTNGQHDVFVAPNPLYYSPMLSWLGTGGYAKDGVAPNSGAPNDTVFRFKVKLTDADGDEPFFVKVLLRKNGQPWRSLNMRGGTGSTAAGRIYTASRTLPAGNYSYSFRATDDDGYGGGEPTKARPGPRIPSPPFLAWTGAEGYQTDGCQPEVGLANHTRFRFMVRYRDTEADMPLYVRVSLRRDGSPYRTFAMLPRGTDPVAGIVYRVARKLPKGNYTYRFRTEDDDGKAFLPLTGRVSGPEVRTSLTATNVSGLSAAPTNAGAQITFSLTSRAQVQARILNIAGRPVKTLCRAKACEAGTNALLWNAQSDRGLPVPNGTYLVEVTAKAADGMQGRSLAQVRVAR